jgi:hypothetical protein
MDGTSSEPGSSIPPTIPPTGGLGGSILTRCPEAASGYDEPLLRVKRLVNFRGEIYEWVVHARHPTERPAETALPTPPPRTPQARSRHTQQGGGNSGNKRKEEDVGETESDKRIRRMVEYKGNIWTCPYKNDSTPAGIREWTKAIHIRGQRALPGRKAAGRERRGQIDEEFNLRRRHKSNDDSKATTGDYRLPFGKYKGAFLSDVPAEYLHWCVENQVHLKRGREELHDALARMRLVASRSVAAADVFDMSRFCTRKQVRAQSKSGITSSSRPRQQRTKAGGQRSLHSLWHQP